jgi:flagellar motor protein MotB
MTWTNGNNRLSSRCVFCLTLAVGLSALNGCRIFERKTAAPQQPFPAVAPIAAPSPAVPVVRGTNPVPPTTQAMTTFKPPMLAESSAFAPMVPSSPSPKGGSNNPSNNLPAVESPKETIVEPLPQKEADTPDPQIEAMKKRVEELEKKLAEKEKETVGLPNLLPSVVEKKPLNVPAVNVAGVTVKSDEKSVRFVVLDENLFKTGTHQLNPTAEDTLRRIAGEIRAAYPEAMVEIEGHTDNIIHDPSNASQKNEAGAAKSSAVLDYFVKTLRWNPAKIRMSSFGSSKPAADNGTAEGRSKNNRIEIVVMPSA